MTNPALKAERQLIQDLRNALGKQIDAELARDQPSNAYVTSLQAQRYALKANLEFVDFKIKTTREAAQDKAEQPA